MRGELRRAAVHQDVHPQVSRPPDEHAAAIYRSTSCIAAPLNMDFLHLLQDWTNSESREDGPGFHLPAGSTGEYTWFYRVCTLMENLEKSWNIKRVISRPGSHGKNVIPKVLEKSWKCFIFTCSFTQFYYKLGLIFKVVYNSIVKSSIVDILWPNTF